MPVKLAEGKLIPCALMALDVVGHSSVVRGLGTKKVAELFETVEQRVRTELGNNEGLLLGWQGDGGIAVFPGHDDIDDKARVQYALRAAETVLHVLDLINRQHRLEAENCLRLRIALHHGQIIYHKAHGSIHSPDVNFVAHLEHSLPEDIIGLSEEFRKPMESQDQKRCLQLGVFEDHNIFLYGMDPVRNAAAELRHVQKQTEKTMGKLCLQDGLIHFEFREKREKSLPPFQLFGRAESEIMMCGVSLATSFKQDDMIVELRAANKRGVRLSFLVLDPEGIGQPFARGIDSIEGMLKAVDKEVQAGNFSPEAVEVRGMSAWPKLHGHHD